VSVGCRNFGRVWNPFKRTLGVLNFIGVGPNILVHRKEKKNIQTDSMTVSGNNEIESNVGGLFNGLPQCVCRNGEVGNHRCPSESR
jgi:hypothetical protein